MTVIKLLCIASKTMGCNKAMIIHKHSAFQLPSLIKLFQPGNCSYLQSHGKGQPNIHCLNLRSFATKAPIKSTPTRRQVYVSQSQCIYDNLALEDWLYHNAHLAECEYLLLWRNNPAVVIGRHQNPWMEANVRRVGRKGVNIARRASGGGTVYHDLGNLNLSFLSARDRYDRRRNLELVVDAIQACGDVDVSINSRDDILLNQMFKISGTASKLGRTQAYHHLTLLHSVDVGVLQEVLESRITGATTKATASVPAPVRNLEEEMPGLTIPGLMGSLGEKFSYQVAPGCCTLSEVDPTDEALFPGVTDSREELTSWPWMFGKTPKFSLHRKFTGHMFHDKQCSISVDLLIEKGKVSDVTIEDQSGVMEGLLTLVLSFYREHLIGEELRLENLDSVREKFVTFCDMVFVDKGNENYTTAMWLSDRVHSCLDFV